MTTVKRTTPPDDELDHELARQAYREHLESLADHVVDFERFERDRADRGES